MYIHVGSGYVHVHVHVCSLVHTLPTKVHVVYNGLIKHMHEQCVPGSIFFILPLRTWVRGKEKGEGQVDYTRLPWQPKGGGGGWVQGGDGTGIDFMGVDFVRIDLVASNQQIMEGTCGFWLLSASRY